MEEKDPNCFSAYYPYPCSEGPTRDIIIKSEPLPVFSTPKPERNLNMWGYLTCLLRNLYASQEATVRTGHGTTDWFQIGKGVRQGCLLSPCLFNSYAEYIMRNAALEEAQAGIKIARRNINNLRYAIWHHPYGRKWRGTKMPLDESEKGECKSWLKTQYSEN